MIITGQSRVRVYESVIYPSAETLLGQSCFAERAGNYYKRPIQFKSSPNSVPSTEA